MNHAKRKHNPTRPIIYQIRVKGHLGDSWSSWFDDLSLTLENDGDTLITGPVVDQSALYGLLKKVHDLGLPLISVNQVACCDSAPPDDHDKAKFDKEGDVR